MHRISIARVRIDEVYEGGNAGRRVQAKSPFTNALTSAKTNVVPAACVYDAKTVHANHEQDLVDRGFSITQISGLGDAASWAGQDEVGVQAIVRNLVIDANFKGQWPDVPDAAKPRPVRR